MTISQEALEHLAFLSRLQLTPESSSLYGTQINSILEYVDTLQGVSAEESVSVVASTLRKDVVTDCSLDKKVVLDSAAHTIGDYIAAPHVFKSNMDQE